MYISRSEKQFDQKLHCLAIVSVNVGVGGRVLRCPKSARR